MMPFTWDATTGRYLDDGQPVPATALRAAVRAAVDDSADRLGILAERLQTGRLDVPGWREASRSVLRTGYGLATSLAHGGIKQLDPATRGWLGGQLRSAYSFMDVFALDIAQGRADPASDAFRARLGMYAEAAHGVFHAGRQRERQRAGFEQERRVLVAGAANCDDCVALAGRGWQAIGSLPPPGQDSQCLSRCKCEMEFRASVAEEAAA